MNFLFQKQIKWKSVLASKKAVFWEEIRKLLAKIIFLWTIKTHEILRKQHFFWIWSFYFRKNTVKVGFGYRFWLRKKAVFFLHNIWIFYFRKNKMKAGFDCEISSFGGRNTETAGQNYFLVSFKNLRNSAKTVLFSGSEFFIPKIQRKLVLDTGFGCENSNYFLHMNFLFQKK